MNNTALGLDQVMEAETELLDSDDLHEAALRNLGPAGAGLAAVYPDLAPGYRPSLPLRLLRGAFTLAARPWREPAAGTSDARMGQALRRFASHLTVLASRDANVITLRFSHGDPVLAARVLDALLSAYAERRSRLYNDPQISALQNAADASGQRLTAAEETLARFRKSHGISDAAAQRALLLKRRSSAEEAAAGADADALEQKSRLDSLAAQLAAEPATIAIYAEKDPDTRVQTLLAGLQDLRARQAALGNRYLETSRTVQDLNAQVGARTRELENLRRDPSPSILRTGRNPSIDAIHLERIRAATQFAAASARHRASLSEGAAVNTQLLALDDDQVALDGLQRDVSLAADSVTAQSHLLAARRLTEAEDLERTARVRIIQPARVPTRPGRLPLLVALASLLLAGAITAARVAASNMLSGSVWTPEGLTMATGLDVLAVFSTADMPMERGGLETFSAR